MKNPVVALKIKELKAVARYQKMGMQLPNAQIHAKLSQKHQGLTY
ncbi:hypothetical protein [Bartonella sp. CE47NXGY]